MSKEPIGRKRRRRGRKAGAATAEGRKRTTFGRWGVAAALLSFCFVWVMWKFPFPSGREEAPSIDAGFLESLPEYDPYFSRFLQRVREAPHRAEGYAALGLVYEANQFLSEARRCYQNALRLDPDQLLTRYHLAIIQQKLGDSQEAETLYRAILDRHPEFTPALHRLGDLLAEAGKNGEAEAAFRRVMELAPESAVGYASAASIKLREREYEAAAVLAEKAIAAQPGARLPHFQLGRAYEGLGRGEEAARERELGAGAVKLFLPDDWSEAFPRHKVGVPAQVRLERARAYLAQGDLQGAARHLSFALEWYPADVELMIELGATYLLLDEPEKACESLDRARLKAGNDPRLLANLAMCKVLLGNLEEAMAAADQAVLLAPNSPMSHLARGRVMMRQGRFSDALDNLRRAVELDDKDATLQLELGNVYMLMNHLNESRRCYQAAVDLDSSNVEGRLRLGDMCAQLGDLVEAHSQLEAARRMAPNHPQVLALSAQLESMDR